MSKLDGTIDFREPTEDEKSARGAKFVGLILSIFWDGDDAYYPCEVTGYDATSLQHTVRYFNANNEDEAKATEDFSSTLWKIWPGSKDQYLSLHPETKKREEKLAKPKAAAKMNYFDMVMEAVVQLDEKGGSSLQGIRKFIQTTFAPNCKAVSSFNNLTLKAINMAVADNMLERNGHSFRLSWVEKDRRKRAIVQQQRAAERAEYERLHPPKHSSSSNGRSKTPSSGGAGRSFYKRASQSVAYDYSQDFKYGAVDEGGEESVRASEVLEQFSGTVLENNRHLRKQLADFRKSRDDLLQNTFYPQLEFFLNENNYFQKLQRKEAERAMQAENSNSAATPVLDSKQLSALGKKLSSGNDEKAKGKSVMSLTRRVHILKAADVVSPAVVIPDEYAVPTTTLAEGITTDNTSISGKQCAVLLSLAAPSTTSGPSFMRHYTIDDVVRVSHFPSTDNRKLNEEQAGLVDGHRVCWPGVCLTPEVTVLYRYLLAKLGYSWYAPVEPPSASAPAPAPEPEPLQLSPPMIPLAAGSSTAPPAPAPAPLATLAPVPAPAPIATPEEMVVESASVAEAPVPPVPAPAPAPIHPSRFNATQLVSEISKLKQISHQNVFYLEKLVDTPTAAAAAAMAVEANEGDPEDGEQQEVKSSENEDEDKDILRFTTVLRDCDGAFLPHVAFIMRLTQSYAQKDTIPISNFTHIQYTVPNTVASAATGSAMETDAETTDVAVEPPRVVRRLFCDTKRFAEVFKNVIVDTIKKKPLLTGRLLELLHGKPEVKPEVKTETKTASVDTAAAPVTVTEAASSTDGSVTASSSANGDTSGIADSTSSVVPVPAPLPATPTPIEVPLLGKQLAKLLSPTTVLHDYQVYGISWLVQMYKLGMPMILGDQMGLGKTVQTIGFITYLIHELKQRGPYFIVVPLSVLSNWANEIDKFCPSLRAVRFHGPKSERSRIKQDELSDLRNFDIILTTYEMFVSESQYFKRRFMYTAVIVDEGHRLKNNKNQLSEKLRSIPTLCKVILTGTPMQNNMRELWALLHYLTPEVFPVSTVANFEQGFDLNKGTVDNDVLRRARRLLTVFMLRRVKADIDFKLPHKKEVVVLVPLSDDQIAWYKYLMSSMDDDMVESIVADGQNPNTNTATAAAAGNTSTASLMDLESGASTSGGGGDATVTATADAPASSSGSGSGSGSGTGTGGKQWRKLLNLVLQLRKVCNHIYLMPDGDAETLGKLDALDAEVEAAADPAASNVKAPKRGKADLRDRSVVLREKEHKRRTKELELNGLVRGSGKLTMLDRILPRLKADGHRVLIFSQFTSMLDILQEYCDLRQYNSVRLDGNTNRVQRRLDCKQFNAPNSKIFIFLISTRAGGLGINLATADTVILYDSDWNPQVDLQAMERVHRIGQTKPVRIYRLICNGSVEERMLHKANKKLFLNAMVAEGGGRGRGGQQQDEEELDADGNVKEGDESDLEDQPVNSGGITKAELVSLIRYGANAILESLAVTGGAPVDKSLTDKQLDCLLELDTGRLESNNPNCAMFNTENAAAASAAAATATATAASATDMEDKQEVDLKTLNSFLAGSFAKAGAGDDAGANDANSKHYKPLRQSFQFDPEAHAAAKAKVDAGGVNTSNMIDDTTKRDRKQRISLVSGKGTGYGGAVPVLAEFGHNERGSYEYTSTNDPQAIATVKSARQRTWTHMPHCVLCGLHRVRKETEEEEDPMCSPIGSPAKTKKSPKSTKKMTKKEKQEEEERLEKEGRARKAAEARARAAKKAKAIADEEQREKDSVLLKCAYCPNVCHTKCVQGTVLAPKTDSSAGNLNSFVCTHHHCVICNRNTSAAGGLLFRCVSCVTAYCEDCLPSDDIDDPDGHIESIGGKHLTLEEDCGYFCRQAYYIRCTNCVQEEEDYERESDEESDEESEEEAEGAGRRESRSKTRAAEVSASNVQTLPTHSLKLFLEEEEEQEEEEEEEQEEEEEEEESAPAMKGSTKKATPAKATPAKRGSTAMSPAESGSSSKRAKTSTPAAPAPAPAPAPPPMLSPPTSSKYNMGSTGSRSSSRVAAK